MTYDARYCSVSARPRQPHQTARVCGGGCTRISSPMVWRYGDDGVVERPWLNESFATWMSARLIADWKPEWNTRAHDQQARLLRWKQDTKTNARRINQPAESKSDIANAFDGITYQKGGSVLATFENIAGSENFRHAVHDYLTAHMFGNARAEDFLDALARSSKPEISGAFSTFLKQAGCRSFQQRCTAKRASSRLLKLSSGACFQRVPKARHRSHLDDSCLRCLLVWKRTT